jgi:2-(3-amino-3-carboxypropyl)histidine synthase
MSNYQFNIKEIIDEINKIKAHKVGLQFPEGLKIHAISIARQLEEETGVTVFISGDPCFGACDVADVHWKNMVDLLVHFGHTPLPLQYEVPVLFMDTQFKLDPYTAIEEALDMLKDYKTIGLVTTTQHLHLINELIVLLEKKGKKVLIKEGVGTRKAQVLGCNFSAIEDLPVDAFLFVGSGNFHPLGIKLSTGKPVIIADPYRNEARSIDKFADRILRIRFARITKAQEAKRFGIIVSSKKGQQRMELAIRLKKLIQKMGKEAYIIFLDQISPDILIPYREIDAFIITACPRIAIDDAEMYKKPVITPDELLIVLDQKQWDEYKLDEIRYNG